MKTMLKKVLFISLFFSANVELLSAAVEGNIEKVREALEKAADVDEQDKYGYTALMKAAWSGQPEIVELLLTKKADVDEQTEYGCTALAMAACGEKTVKIDKQKYRKIIDLLLATGADPLVKSGNGNTILEQVDSEIIRKYMREKTSGILMKEVSSQLLLELPNELAKLISKFTY